MQKFVIALIFILAFGFISITEIQAQGEVSALIIALRKNGIKVSEQTNYSKLIEKLESMNIQVSEPERESVTKYLERREASDLVRIQTSKPGVLIWHFHSVIFLKKDLIFASYEDGEISGGDILLKVIFTDNQVTNMKSLWDYH